jgi:prolyl oligopeptidase
MYISYKKGMEPKANHPTYLYAYGGFNIAQTPYFNVRNLVWMEIGGIFALPNIRGGDEYGKPWHDQGIKLNKQNVFDDFIAAAEYLIKEGYTTTLKLAISGRSNGGLLTGACLTQRPDLYGVTVPVVGVLDMIRFEKFTVGWGWTSDYGSVDNEDEFKALLNYSPYHNVKEGTQYPPTLITTGDHDDRVYPAHSYKFAAAMQHAHRGENPILIRIDTRAGHGGGKPTGKLIEEYSDELIFIVDNLEMEPDN